VSLQGSWKCSRSGRTTVQPIGSEHLGSDPGAGPTLPAHRRREPDPALPSYLPRDFDRSPTRGTPRPHHPRPEPKPKSLSPQTSRRSCSLRLRPSPVGASIATPDAITLIWPLHLAPMMRSVRLVGRSGAVRFGSLTGAVATVTGKWRLAIYSRVLGQELYTPPWTRPCCKRFTTMQDKSNRFQTAIIVFTRQSPRKTGFTSTPPTHGSTRCRIPAFPAPATMCHARLGVGHREIDGTHGTEQPLLMSAWRVLAQPHH